MNFLRHDHSGLPTGRRAVQRAAVLVLVVVLSACGREAAEISPVDPGLTSAPAAASSGDKLNACELLTPQDAEAFLGTTAPEPTVPLAGDALYIVSSCSYRTDDNKIVLLVMQMADGNAGANRTTFEGDRSRSMENYGVDAIDVPDLGESAYWISSPQSYFNDLHFLRGDTQFVLSTSLDETTETPPAALVELAQALIGRLP